MKTVAKKAVKKMPPKVAAKVVTKVAAKKTVKPVAKTAVKTTAKAVVKPVKQAVVKSTPKSAKPGPIAVAKKIVKPVSKSSAKVVTKSVNKPAVKATIKAIAKPATKPAVKPAVKPVTKPAVKAVAKPAAVSSKTVAKKVEAAIVESKASKAANKAVNKAVQPAKSLEKTKTVSKPPKEESNLKQPMVIASKIAPLETKELSPAAPALSKARTSRLASLTVPSMAQSVASTAAKSSYGPHVPSLAIIPPPHFAPKHNPKLANNWKTKTAEEMTDDELLAMPDSEYMNIKQMMYFRLKLIELKHGILANAGATSEHLRDESAVVPDPTDRATIEEEHALELRTRDRERKLLKKIEQSIARIDAGDYGYCDETGEAIGVGRLLARPTATLSLEAQQRRELKQKMYGD
jgi:DnaK suppressor protein